MIQLQIDHHLIQLITSGMANIFEASGIDVVYNN